MNFKNNIERCKLALRMGYRVWYRANIGWLALDKSTVSLTNGVEYKINPADVEAFEADLAAREDAARRQRTPAPTPTFAEQAQSLQDQNAALKRANEQLREHVVSMEEEMRKLRADTAEDLLIQLRSKLGPRASVTVHMNPEL